MADGSKIEWTDATWNPLRGCSRVSEGCRHCYAEGVAARFSGPGMPYEGLAKRVALPGGGTEARWTGKVAFAGDQVLTQPLRWKRPRRIFVNSMSDLFHESVPVEVIDRIFAIMALAPQHTFQVLTKRPERMRDYLGELRDGRRVFELACDMVLEELLPVLLLSPGGADPGLQPAWPRIQLGRWPLSTVWLGVSVEDQGTADTRIPHLLSTPAAVRFISAEPLLGPIDLTNLDHLGTLRAAKVHGINCLWKTTLRHRLDWVIAGGESGPHARPMHPGWARSLRDQCAAAGVAFFFKQWGEWAPDGVPWEHQAVDVLPDGRVRQWDDGDGRLTHPDMRPMFRVGKSRAGRLLDGVEHDGFPASGGAQ